MYFFQRTFIYHPTKEKKHDENVKLFKIDNENIKVIVLNEDKKDAVLYFGGRSEAVSDNIKGFQKYLSNYAVYLVNYRGYGGSSGIPTEENLYKDATFIYEKIKLKHKNVSVVGRSLGTGVASFVASKQKINKLVLLTPYDSILNMAEDKYPYYPINLILKDRFESIKRVENIKVPTLVFLASNDKTIDSKYSQNLIDKFDKSILEVIKIKNSNHINIIHKAQYLKNLALFLEKKEN